MREFANLKAEIARHGVDLKKMSNSLGINERTLKNKIKGLSDFRWEQTKIIHEEFFPKEDKDYLFYREINNLGNTG